ATATNRIQYPLKSVRTRVTRMPAWLTAAWDAVMRATASNSAPASGGASGANAARANRTVPTLIAASTATRPARVNQAGAHPHPRPRRVAAQGHTPPAAGNGEAIGPIVAATHRANRPPSGQPMPIAAPPAAQYPTWNDVTPPARMQMIDSEMAK